MKIFNTLTRHKDEFHPINEGKVGILSVDQPYMTIFTSEMQDR